MLVELDRAIFIAILAGLISGFLESILNYILQGELYRQTATFKQISTRLFIISFSYSVILGLGAFLSAIFDTSITTSELNKFTWAMAICFMMNSVLFKFQDYIIDRFKITLIKLKIIKTKL